MNRESGPFQLRVHPSAWSRISVPIVFQSIGWNEFPYNDRIDLDRLRLDVLEPVLNRTSPTLFSVRNTGTFKRLTGLIPELRLIADPAFFVAAPTAHVERRTFNIALCWTSDRLDKRWPRRDAERAFFESVCAACEGLVAQADARIWLVPHIQGIDAPLANDLRVRFGERFRSLEEDRPDLYPATLENVRGLIAFYRQMSVVLGMRKHSVIVPLGQNVPAIGLGDQAEVRWALEDLDLTSWHVHSDDDVERKVAGLLREAHQNGGNFHVPRLRDARQRFDEFCREALGLAARI